MQFITGGGATLGMSGAKIEINGKLAPPQLLRAASTRPLTSTSGIYLSSSACRAFPSLSRHAAVVCVSSHLCSYRKRDGSRVIHCIDIDWGRTVDVCQLLVWNFNGQGDLTDRGIKRLFLTLDGEALSPPQVPPQFQTRNRNYVSIV